MNTKSKRKFVPLKVKLEALKRLDKGETIKKLAAEYGVGEVTVGDWRRNRQNLEKYSSGKCSENASDRKCMRKSEYEKTSEALFLWFSQQRQKGSPISGPMLQHKALLFRKEFKEGEDDFSASVGWLQRWKSRYGVRQLEMCGEKLSGDSEGARNYDDIPKLSNLISQIPGCKDASEIEVAEWMKSDEQYELTDASIIEMLNEPTEDGEEEDLEETAPKMSHSEGLTALEAALRYVEQQPEATPTDTLLFKRWRDIAAQKRCNIHKQKSIKDFFKK